MTAHPDDLVGDLQRGDAYGRGVTVPIVTRTTHASWVFIVGDDVWKVKRPVDFGFLDFRTIDARRHDCEEEVRLGKRLAPDVYLGVEPVRRGADGRHNIGGDGPVADWAVHMRRLPDDASAASLLARGALDADALARLAEVMAAFLAAAPARPELGTTDALRANVVENFTQVTPFVGDLVAGDSFAEVQAFQIGRLEEDAELFRARVAAERIREGHGDLRLEHVYFVPQPIAIDCIEFNERFRSGDVAAEVAFLAMELDAARRPDLAAGFLARFAEASTDFALYGVLDFYLSYRAWVRGKVAAFVAADPSPGGDVRRDKRAEATRNFALARAYAGKPLDQPFVIVVGGLIGTGKSTLAAALGRELAVPVVSSDRVRKALAGLAPTERGGPALYEPAAVERVYDEIISRAAAVVGARRSVILDATFSTRRWRDAAAQLARAAGARFALVETRCPDRDLLRQRLSRRRDAASVSDATDAQLAEIERRFEPFGPLDPGPHLPVDTGGTPAAALAEALTSLGRIGIFAARDRCAS
jgi:uncharacterized protein